MADDNVIPFSGVTKLELTPESIIKDMPELESAVLIGWAKDNTDMLYFAASSATTAEILEQVELAKHILMKGLLDGNSS